MVRIAALLALLVACAVENPPLSSVESSLFCDLFICGDNAATAGDGLLFDELDLFGEPNHAGVKLVGARHGTTWLQLDIQGDRMRALDPATGTWRTDDLLIGTILKFESSYGEIFEVLIDDFNEGMVSYRAGVPTEVPIYRMMYRRPALGHIKFERYACNQDVIDADWPSAGRYALVFRGDRFDQTKRVIANDPNNGWSFLACAGSAAAKLHLLRHTYAGGLDPAGPYPTTLDQRTTLLKAITGDYCGTGAPQFTVAGNPLTFTAAAPFAMPALAPVASYEAIWSPAGAVCLDIPRRDPTRVPDPLALRWTRAQVATACGRTIPSCGLWALWWPWLGYAVTANPA
jgi:ADYC domain